MGKIPFPPQPLDRLDLDVKYGEDEILEIGVTGTLTRIGDGAFVPEIPSPVYFGPGSEVGGFIAISSDRDITLKFDDEDNNKTYTVQIHIRR